ncbi:MAG: hypothetical protein ACRCT1_00565 [Microcoleaceae cyanobacterium]
MLTFVMISQRRKKEEGRRKKEEGRRKNFNHKGTEAQRKREEGRRKKEEENGPITYYRLPNPHSPFPI